MLGPYPLESGRITGGVEAVVTYLAEELTTLNGLDLHVVAASADISKAFNKAVNGFTVHYLPSQKRLAALTFNTPDVQRLRNTIRELQPDIVHAQGSTVYAGAAVGCPYAHVVTVHGVAGKDERIAPGVRNHLRAMLVSLYERRCISQAANVIVISPYVRIEFQRTLRARTYPLENPIHRRFYELANDEVPDTVLFAGRVIRRKGIHNLLKAISAAKQTLPGLELRIAGETRSDPAYFASLERYVRENDLSANVQFLGPLDEETIFKEFARCSLVVLASRQETAPMVIQQAMAAGKPVVATRVCGIPYQVVDQMSGLLVDYDDVQGLANAMLSLLADKGRRLEMGKQARRLAMRFRADVVARKTREIYEEVRSSWPAD